jgi:hypothetical protein
VQHYLGRRAVNQDGVVLDIAIRFCHPSRHHDLAGHIAISQ